MDQGPVPVEAVELGFSGGGVGGLGAREAGEGADEGDALARRAVRVVANRTYLDRELKSWGAERAGRRLRIFPEP